MQLVFSGRIEPGQIYGSLTDNFLTWPINPEWPTWTRQNHYIVAVGGNYKRYPPFVITMIFCLLNAKQHLIRSIVMMEMIWISTDFPWVQRLLPCGYLLQILLALIDRPLASIVTSRPSALAIGSFDCPRLRHPLHFRPITSSLPQFRVIWSRRWKRSWIFCFYILFTTLINRLWRKCYWRNTFQNVTFYRIAS